MVDLTQTIPAMAIDAADQWPERVAIDDHGITLTFEELKNRSKEAARGFIASGLKAGDRFAIWAPNIHEWIWIAIGGMMAGGVLVPLNTRYKGIEAGDILNRSHSQLLFTVSDFLDTNYLRLLNAYKPECVHEIIVLRGQPADENAVTNSLAEFLARGHDVTDQHVDQCIGALRGDSLSDILYTSGTTGVPKGVMSNHGQVVATFKLWAAAVGLNKQDRYLIVNPFFHVFGCKAGWLACLLTGATAFPEPFFDADTILKTIAEKQISMLPGAPTVFQSLLSSPQLIHTNLSSLRCAVTGAASVPEQLVRDMKQILGFKEVYTGYGLTECGVVSICRQDDDLETIANTAGCAIDGIEIKILDKNNKQLPSGEIGNIFVKGFNVMQGYLDDPLASEQAIDQNGWLNTGDIGWQDTNGYIKITDRAKDMYICGGFNCYPAEIENLLLRNPFITEVAVTSIKDDRLGSVGVAHIVLKEEGKPSPYELRNWFREHMANYKVPRVVHFVTSLPRNASGKVQKFLLEQ
ncbi:AMP-binding protein [Microbulbifer sp. 2205BS26-8]|uniref:AMP-binding protein n=1 Tax=Microbulbifer sp. 2205BS26-8 TaxID=3064386 RepID=UPI0027400FD0|nr:AMP-binding protein [Microbulbifer sp. 2205BS26-8]MDP5209254.1 AMP-binding protein [Microbulbifer sp. 2205BS26-8]